MLMPRSRPFPPAPRRRTAYGACRRIGVLSALLLFALSSPAAAAPGDLKLATGFPTAGAGAVKADSGGAVVAAGTFFGSVDFGGGLLTSGGMFTPDVFFAKWDASGAHQWSFHVTHNNGFGGVTVTAMAIDAGGDIYVTGQIFDGDVDFGGGSLTGPGLYVVKLSSSGAHLWSATFGDGGPNAIDVSPAGLAITGQTSASVNFGGGALTSAGLADAFVAVLDASGGHVFSAIYGDATHDQSGQDIGIDATGNVVMAGGTNGNVDFGGGPLAATGASLFVAAYGPTGSHAWSKVIAGSFAGGSSVFSVHPSLDLGAGIAAVAGEMRGAVDFGGGALSSNGAADIYAAVYDATTGAHQWSLNIGDATSEIPNDLSLDSTGGLVISGTMFGAFDAGGGALAYAGGSDLFAVSLDSAGAHRWSAGFGTAGSDYLAGNTIGGNGDVVLWGAASSGIDFGSGPLADASLYLARFEGHGGGGGPSPVPAAGPIGAALLVLAMAFVGIPWLRQRNASAG